MFHAKVLRYGHRSVRDYRVTTHCALVARALGAGAITICGAEDEQIKKSVEGVVKKWGGNFKISFSSSWKEEFKKFKKQRNSAIVHLTMYGLPIQGHMKEIRKFRRIMVVVGAEKVERGIYENSDFNISITQQPHSEIAALAIFLRELFQESALNKKFPNAKIRILPQKSGKKVLKAQ